MEYKVLYRKYRPQTFSEVTGQTYVVKTLQNAIISKKISHAYIFTGPRGTGKTSLAKIFAKSINCENSKDGNPCLSCNSCNNFKNNPDIIEIDAASNNGVDEIRELINNVRLAPSYSKYKVYIIDEVHMLSQSAFNALLLTLEEPPEHVIFILATTDIQNVPTTILSRVQRFDFSRISVNNIVNRLTFVCHNENIDIEDAAIREIAILAEGGLRDALSILDQVSSQANYPITIDTVQQVYGLVSSSKIKKVISTVEKNDIDGLLNILDELKNSSIDSKILIIKLIEELKNIAINIKTGYCVENRLSFTNIKNIIMELNDGLNRNNTIDPYIIIQMILLGYMTPSKSKKKLETVSNIEKYFPGNNQTDPNLLKKLIKVRINNCFVDADKINLLKSQKKMV